MQKITLLPLILSLLLPGITASAQSKYNAHQAFAPLFYPHNGNAYRSADGSPGPGYWQNRADYRVKATFDTASKRISGEVKITYTNNSPDKLPFVWLELSQNIDRADSRANLMRNPAISDTGNAGFHIRQVMLIAGDRAVKADYIIQDTRMQVRLPAPLQPKRGKLQLLIRYDYTLQPSGGGGRSGYMNTSEGRIYEVSYWYPRMKVYDDLLGWNTLPFLGGGEFYMDYGDIDYTVTLPAGMIVAGSGLLQNPKEVLTATEIQRLEKARHSDKTIMIRTPEETSLSATRGSASGRLTWHFHMNNTRDVAWVASQAYVWDAARVNLPDGKTCLAMSVYPPVAGGDSAWGRATEYLKAALEIFSKKWFTYPYPVAVNAGGPVGGMEYPGIVFDHWHARGKSLFMLTAHEFGHNWFPMVVGSDERRFAWMDEGFNTFIDVYAHEAFNHGEYAPKRDGEYAPHGGNPAEEIVPVITQQGIAPVISLADALPSRDVHPLEYFKAAFGLVLLREVVIGHDRFDYAFRQYIHDWAYKHPSPWDFFREIENGCGENLSWFWRGWFIHNWKLDQGIKNVRYVKNNPANGALVTIENLGQMPMPVIVQITEANGKAHRLKLPVEVWQRGGEWTFKVKTTGALKSIILDPGKQLPDTDRANNVWTAPG